MILKPRMIPKPRTPGNQNGMVQQWSGVHFCFFRSIVLAVSSRYMPIWRRCHVECGRKCVRGRNAAARTLLSHPTPPHPPASGDDAMLTVAAIVTRMLVSESCGWWLGNGLFWLRNPLWNRLFLVAESVIFGCGSAFFWLRKRVWFWLRNRRNLVAEASKYGFGIGIYSIISNDLRLHSGQGIFAAGKVGEVVALALWCTAQCLLQLLLQCNRAVIMLLLCLILLG